MGLTGKLAKASCGLIYILLFLAAENLVAQLVFTENPIPLKAALIFDETMVEVRIKNFSKNRSVDIISIKPSCGCTVISDFNSTIQPNRVISVPVKIKARRTAGHQKVTLVATWKYQDEDTRYHSYTVFERDIIDPVKLSRKKLDFGNLDAESLLKGICQELIVEIDSSHVELGSIDLSESLGDVFELEIDKQSENRVILRLFLVKQNQLVGVFNGSVVLRGRLLRNGADVAWSIPVFATLESTLELKPSFVLMPKINIGDAFEEKFLIHGPSGFKIAKVVISDPELTIRDKTRVATYDSSEVSVQISGGKSLLSSSGHIDFHVILESAEQNLIYRVQYVLIGASEPPVQYPTNDEIDK